MKYLEKTNEWIDQTQENVDHEQEYKRKLANNESTSMFKVKTSRTGKRLVPKHKINTYDETLHNFIHESSIMCTNLNKRITELEDKINELENK